jgi:hypothetical protein
MRFEEETSNPRVIVDCAQLRLATLPYAVSPFRGSNAPWSGYQERSAE